MPDVSAARSTIGVFGLGTMGAPIAERLAAGGYSVAGCDLDPPLARRAADAPRDQHDPRDAAVIVSCVTDEAAARVLLLGTDGLLHTARAGQRFIDHTTTSAAFAREAAARAAEHGATFIDAPISGGAAGAIAGTLSAFVGGDADTFAFSRRLLGVYCSTVTHLGAVGAGQLGKLANQIAIAGIVRGLAEAVAFARSAALDVPALLTALAAGSARSNQLEQHARKLEQESSFAVNFDWLERDLALAVAAGTGTALPLTELVLEALRHR